MTAAAIALPLPPPRWTLQSTLWHSLHEVELWLTADDGSESLLTVEVRLDLPRTASEPAYREELVVLDVEGSPLDVEGEVERSRELILREFYSAKSLGRA
jgi:hypothetical protein